MPGTQHRSIDVIGDLSVSGTTTANASTATKLAAGSYFSSSIQTGTGSAQNIAHGLGVVPSLVNVMILTSSGDPGITRGTATTANCVVTAAIGATYYVTAIK